jgi:hypothetical protein
MHCGSDRLGGLARVVSVVGWGGGDPAHRARCRKHDGFWVIARKDGAKVAGLNSGLNVSCSHSGPQGGSWALLGKHGGTKPAGRVRDNMIWPIRPDRRTRKGTGVTAGALASLINAN